MAPVSALAALSSSFDKLQEHLSHVVDMHPGVNVGSTPVVESRPGLNTGRQERRVENTTGASRPRAPAVNDGRAHDRRLDTPSGPSVLDEQLGVAVERRLRHGPEAFDVADVGPHLGVQLAEVLKLHDDARAAEVDVEGGQRGGRALAHACQEGTHRGLVVGVAVVFQVRVGWSTSFLLFSDPGGSAVWCKCTTTYELQRLHLMLHPSEARSCQSRPSEFSRSGTSQRMMAAGCAGGR